MNQETIIAKKISDLAAKNIQLWTEDGKLKFKAAAGTLTAEDKAFLKENKQAVIECLLHDVIRIEHDPQHQNDPFPLTEIQQAYVLGRNRAFSYGGTACHIYLEFDYDELDPEQAQAAWNQLIRRHPMLRVTMHTDGYQQIAEEVPEFRVAVYDLRSDSAEEVDRRREEIRDAMDHSIYDVTKFPMYAVAVSRSADCDRMHFSMEFAVADWTSIWNLLYEFEQICFHGRACAEPPSVTFRDYLIAEKKLRSGSRFYRDREYWMRRLESLPDAPELPVNAETKDETVHFSREEITLSKSEWDSFCQIAGSLGVTPSAAVMTAYGTVLARWSRNPSFCLNLSILNRLPLHEEVGSIVGDFTAGSLLEMHVRGGESFLDTVLRTNRQLFDDLDHRLFTGVHVLRELQRVRHGKSQLMPYVFTGAIGLIPTERTSLIGKMTQGGISQTAQVFMDCQAMDSAAGLHINIDTRDGVFKEGMVRDFCEAFRTLLHSLAESSRRWTDSAQEIPLPSAQQEMRRRVNDTAAVQDRYLLHERVLRSICAAPEKLAVADAQCAWNGAELYHAVRRTAAALQESGMCAGERVVIALPKSRWQLAACLAVLALGGVYVPIDVGYGEGRCTKILNKVSPRCVICHSQYPAAIPSGYPILQIDTLTAETDLPSPCPIDGTASAYIIFTSGSTGEPKGVEISHQAAVNTIEAVNRRYGICGTDRVFSISQLNFDLSVYDLFGVISCGGAVVIPDHEQYKNPSHWAEMMERYQVTVWNSVPALMQMYLIYRQFEEKAAEIPLRLALLSGDWIPTDMPAETERVFDGIRIVSLGGATEGSIWSIWHEYVPEDQKRSSIPYGKPMPNQGFFIKDSQMRDCPDWVQGELYITGAGLAEGYYGEEELTRNAFLTRNGIRMYKTGDTGCYHPDGTIEFMGRNDRQVKLRGHRIEPGEIESVMKKTFSLGSVSCFLHGDAADRKLAAVYTAEKEICEADAAQKMALWLPDYMIPTVLIRAETIPLTANGKVDQKALAALADRHLQRNVREAQSNVSMTETEQTVSRILSDLLGTEGLLPDTDLYEAGANSLVLARAAGKLREAVNPQISFDDYLVHLLNTPNVHAVSAFIDAFGKDSQVQETASEMQQGIRCRISDTAHVHIVFTDGLSDSILQRTEQSGESLVYLTGTYDTAKVFEIVRDCGGVTLAGADSGLAALLELACSLAAAGIVPDSVNMLESESETASDSDQMYAGDLCYGLTVSSMEDAEEIRSIMEEFCMGEIQITECRDEQAAVKMLLSQNGR